MFHVKQQGNPRPDPLRPVDPLVFRGGRNPPVSKHSTARLMIVMAEFRGRTPFWRSRRSPGNVFRSYGFADSTRPSVLSSTKEHSRESPLRKLSPARFPMF